LGGVSTPVSERHDQASQTIKMARSQARGPSRRDCPNPSRHRPTGPHPRQPFVPPPDRPLVLMGVRQASPRVRNRGPAGTKRCHAGGHSARALRGPGEHAGYPRPVGR
jgi:hypothetical protein